MRRTVRRWLYREDPAGDVTVGTATIPATADVPCR